MSPPGQDDLRQQLRGLFLEELDDNVRVLSEGLLVLEHDPDGPPAELVQALFRAAHSMKGAAHSADVSPAVAVCARLEDALAAVRANERAVDRPLLETLFADVDELAAIGRALRGDAPAGLTSGGGVAAPPDTAPGGREGAGGQERVRVAVSRLGTLMGQAGEVTSASRGMHVVAGELGLLHESFAARERRRPGTGGGPEAVRTVDRLRRAADRIDRDLRRTAMQLSDTAQQLRLQPCSEVWAGLDRTAHQLAQAAGKQVRLVATGGDVELDRDVAAALREPLLHLIRNAVDHGLELPEVRVAAGKAPEGTIGIAASASGPRVDIRVTDDGAGVDVPALQAAAGRGGAAAEDSLDAAFLPAVSTAATVTEVSGRGVGLDAVRARIESLGGSTHMTSVPGAGVTVVLAVPVTLATMRVLVVRAGHELVAVPVAAVAHVERVRADTLQHVGGRTIAAGDAGSVPVVALRHALGFEATAAEEVAEGAGTEVALVRLVGEPGALLVDALEDELEVVLQPLPARAAGVPAIIGAVALPTGTLALVVNAATGVRRGLAAGPAAAPRPSAAEPARHTILLAEDTLTTRALERSILTAAGYEVTVAADGAQAWDLLQERDVDLVVSDIDMPHLDGIELCRRIRGAARLRDVPIVLVTSFADEDDRQRGLEAGADAYLVKSAFEQAALLDVVRRLL